MVSAPPPAGNHISEDEQRRRPQQKTVELELGLGRRHGEANASEEHSRHQRDPHPGGEARLKGGHQDGKKEKKEKDTVGPHAGADEQDVPPHVGPVRHSGWDGRAATDRQRQQGDAVGQIEGKDRVGCSKVMRRLGRIDGGAQQGQQRQHEPHRRNHALVYGSAD